MFHREKKEMFLYFLVFFVVASAFYGDFGACCVSTVPNKCSRGPNGSKHTGCSNKLLRIWEDTTNPCVGPEANPFRTYHGVHIHAHLVPPCVYSPIQRHVTAHTIIAVCHHHNTWSHKREKNICTKYHTRPFLLSRTSDGNTGHTDKQHTTPSRIARPTVPRNKTKQH